MSTENRKLTLLSKQKEFQTLVIKWFEQEKIACGEKHFELISDLKYDVCVDYDEFAYKYIHEN